MWGALNGHGSSALTLFESRRTMGRNAKFYKSSKAKKKQSSTQSEVAHAAGPAKRSSLQGKHSAEEAPATADEDGGQRITSRSSGNGGATSAPNGRLKSKLWKNLEAQRAREGRGEIATPKEAGIDYIGQWEKKKRR